MAIFMVDLLLLMKCRGTEAMAIRRGRYANRAQEGAPHRLRGTEAARRGDGIDTRRRLLEPAARRLDADRLDEARRRHADLPREYAGEVSRAHRHAACERGDGEIRVRVVDHPRLQIAERLALGRLRGELGAELRLPAGAAEKHDELTRDLERELTTVVLLDE